MKLTLIEDLEILTALVAAVREALAEVSDSKEVLANVRFGRMDQLSVVFHIPKTPSKKEDTDLAHCAVEFDFRVNRRDDEYTKCLVIGDVVCFYEVETTPNPTDFSPIVTKVVEKLTAHLTK